MTDLKLALRFSLMGYRDTERQFKIWPWGRNRRRTEVDVLLPSPPVGALKTVSEFGI